MDDAPASTRPILTSAVAQSEWMASILQDLVEMESPSDHKPSVDAAAARVASLAAGLGGSIKLHPQKRFGDLLEIRFGPARSARKPVLLLGHLDTVWPLGTLAKMPWLERGGKFTGPGVLDMKAGVVVALAAMRLLTKSGLSRPVTLLLNSDEEVGSPVSRRITERLALASAAVLVLEPAQDLACKTARKGVGDYRLDVHGVAAHSGLDFERGRSAVLELARLIEKVAAFTDVSRGLTVNPGVIGGGTRSNVIAEHACAEIDVRIAKASDAARIDKLFRGLKCTDRACRLTVTGGINRPPMERTPANAALYRQARSVAAELGLALPEASVGGGSDGNFTSALGVPTLDGLGAIGDGAHAAHEHVLIEHLAPRAALLAALIQRL